MRSVAVCNLLCVGIFSHIQPLHTQEVDMDLLGLMDDESDDELLDMT